jgi:hypothetical protein
VPVREGSQSREHCSALWCCGGGAAPFGVQVGASTSDGGSGMAQLKEWNDRYGEGGSRKGGSRRIGFHLLEPEERRPDAK